MLNQELHWNLRILTGIPASSLEPQNPHWIPRVYTGFLRSTLESQYKHWNPRVNIESPGSTLEYQVHWNTRILTGIPDSTLEFQDPYGNLRIHTRILADIHGKFVIHITIRGFPSKPYHTTCRNLMIHTAIPESTRGSQGSH